MYGTVALCRVKPANMPTLIALMDAADDPMEGWLGTDVLVSDNHEDLAMLVVRFRDRESYEANADSPEQHERYQRYRALMETDPVWHDGEWTTWP